MQGENPGIISCIKIDKKFACKNKQLLFEWTTNTCELISVKPDANPFIASMIMISMWLLINHSYSINLYSWMLAWSSHPFDPCSWTIWQAFAPALWRRYSPVPKIKSFPRLPSHHRCYDVRGAHTRDGIVSWCCYYLFRELCCSYVPLGRTVSTSIDTRQDWNNKSALSSSPLQHVDRLIGLLVLYPV